MNIFCWFSLDSLFGKMLIKEIIQRMFALYQANVTLI